ncbi:MAG: hypothetical protein M3020_12545 [Myxococcota bacterium]|jgi:hypothetical protein|nr:hypothetical protein [Myxococcota bacterium]
MQLFAVLLGSALSLGLLCVFAALEIAFDLRGVGRANGAWALAFGVEVGPVQLGGVTGSAATKLELRLFGFRVPLPRSREKRAPRPEEPKAPADPGRVSRFFEGLDPVDAGLFVLDERRHIAVESLDVTLDYGFRDVALTGKIAGALYMLAGVLPPRVRIHQNPSWGGAETWQAHLAGRVATWPALVVADVLWYIIRARLRRRPSPPVPPQVEPAAGTAA